MEMADFGDRLRSLRNAALHSGMKLMSEDEIISVLDGQGYLFEDDFINRLAELHHNMWRQWSQEIAGHENISKETLKGWEKLWIPYKELTDIEKAYDRRYATIIRDEILDYLEISDIIKE